MNLSKFHPRPCADCGHTDKHSDVSGCIAMNGNTWCVCTRYRDPGNPRPAKARNTDPETSHAAAASLTADTLRASQAAVLTVLGLYGPCTDVDLADGYARAQARDDVPRQSPSGIRSRRAELVAGGLVKDTGQRVRLESGRMAIVWAVKS